MLKSATDHYDFSCQVELFVAELWAERHTVRQVMHDLKRVSHKSSTNFLVGGNTFACNSYVPSGLGNSRSVMGIRKDASTLGVSFKPF